MNRYPPKTWPANHSVTVLYSITAIISNLQRIKEAKQSFLFSKFTFHSVLCPNFIPLLAFAHQHSASSQGACGICLAGPGWDFGGLPRFLVSVCSLLGARDLSTSRVVRAGIHAAIFTVCRAVVFPWGSWRHLSILGFLPQTTIQAPLSKWQLAVAGADSLCCSHDCCFTLVSSTVLRWVFSLIASSSPLHSKKIFLRLVDLLDCADIVPLALVPYFLCLQAISVFFAPLFPSASKLCSYALLDKSHSRKS